MPKTKVYEPEFKKKIVRLYLEEGRFNGSIYTIFRSEDIYGEWVLEFLTSGWYMEQLWIMWLVLAVLIGIVNTKYLEQKIYVWVHKIMNIITIVFLIYTGFFVCFPNFLIL